MFKPTLIIVDLFCYVALCSIFVISALNGQSGLIV